MVILQGILDKPIANQKLRAFAQVEGWLVYTPEESVTLEISLDGNILDTSPEFLNRPDVHRALPGLVPPDFKHGFQFYLNTAYFTNGQHQLVCTAVIAGQKKVIGELPIEIDNSLESEQLFRQVFVSAEPQRQRQKLQLLIQELLHCPVCHASFTLYDDYIECTKGRHQFKLVEGKPVMISGEPTYQVEANLLNSPTSNHNYPLEVIPPLNEVLSRGGVALEIGSGRRSFGADRLVQVEICTYPFTDVINQTEILPFKDEVFDMVFSMAVTEHVKQPWVLASEMQRVVKKGGVIVVDSAFMQPLHGYPSHYYNMTHFGLRNLFDQLEVISLRPGKHQHPLIALHWILDHFLVDLPVEQRTALGNMTVQQLLEELSKQVQFMRRPGLLSELQLSESRIEELALGYTLVGYKR